jgi:hypothetical protein
VKYKILAPAGRDVLIDGLGAFPGGQEVELTDDQLESFEIMRGMKLNQDNVPDGVQVTVVTEEGE